MSFKVKLSWVRAAGRARGLMRGSKGKKPVGILDIVVFATNAVGSSLRSQQFHVDENRCVRNHSGLEKSLRN
jgi:hypothetical protein